MDITKIAEFIKPELLILVPVLYFIGMGAKQTTLVKDNHIPMLLGICGIVLAVLWVLGTSNIQTYQEGLIAAFGALTQGILTAGGSVYINQIIKQAGKNE